MVGKKKIFSYSIMKLSDLCTPALLYLVLSAISLVIIILTKFQPLSIIIKILFILAWTWILNYLCRKGFTALSWLLVILPYLIMFGIIAMIFEFMKSGKMSMNMYSPYSPTMGGGMPNTANMIPTYNNNLPA